MVELYINKQQQWTELVDIVTNMLAEVDEFNLVNSDVLYKAKPMQHHVCCFKGFLLLYNQNGRNLSTMLDEEDVMDISKRQYLEYLGSLNFPVMICIGLSLALGLVCLCGTDLMGLDRWDWTSGTG
jgi:hypothetical protein